MKGKWYFVVVLVFGLMFFQRLVVCEAQIRPEDGVFAVDLIRSSLIGTTKVSGLEPGVLFPKMVLRDYDGKKVDLYAIEQKMLICYEHVFTEENVKDAFYQMVAREFAGKLKVVVLYNSKPSLEYATRLKNAGVIVVPNFGYADKYLSQAHVPFAYLVDEKKVVKLRYKFAISNWKSLKQSLTEFVTSGEIPVQTSDIITIGEQYVDSPELEATGVSLTQYRGKPTVLLFAPNKYMVPGVETLRKKYRDKINIIIIYRYLSEEKVQGILDYYNLFNLYIDSNDHELTSNLEEAQKYFQPFQNQSENVFLPDLDGYLFNLFNIFHSNTVMVLDTELRLVEGLVAAHAFYDDKEEAKSAPLLENEASRILDTILSK